MELHHIGCAVRDLETAVKKAELLGCERRGEVVRDEEMGVRIAFLRSGSALLELVAPLGDKSPVDSYLKRGGAGPYHVGYLTGDPQRQAARMAEEGWKVVRPEAPAKAFSGAGVVFLYHGSLGLVELIERLPRPRDTLYTRFVKRALDLLFSAALLAVLSPLLLLLAALELAVHGRPVFYRAVRAGRDGVPFVMYKFRTMTEERGPDGERLPGSRRVTPFGRFLRRTSLDELPQLWNILRGEMSFIGPRPLETACVERYSARHRGRLAIRPGLACFRLRREDETGSWTYREQFENDLWYLENASFGCDLKMLFAILRHVIADTRLRERALRPEFDGSNLDWKEEER